MRREDAHEEPEAHEPVHLTHSTGSVKRRQQLAAAKLQFGDSGFSAFAKSERGHEVRWQRRRLHVSMVDAGARNDGPSARLCGRTAGVPAWGGELPRSMHCLAFRRLAIFGRLRWSFLANDLPRSLSSAFRASWRLARQSCLRWSFLARGLPPLCSARRSALLGDSPNRAVCGGRFWRNAPLCSALYSALPGARHIRGARSAPLATRQNRGCGHLTEVQAVTYGTERRTRMPRTEASAFARECGATRRRGAADAGRPRGGRRRRARTTGAGSPRGRRPRPGRPRPRPARG